MTLDFDGSVQSTKGHKEGSAVGVNKSKKGAQSYYPLFCTTAQTGQFFDLFHRPGNVHDSNGAEQFMRDCLTEARTHLPGTILESRMDSAFFSKKIMSVFETKWKPKSWEKSYRFIFTRRKNQKQRKGPIQLDLCEPRDFDFDYKVIVTNKTESAKTVVWLCLKN